MTSVGPSSVTADPRRRIAQGLVSLAAQNRLPALAQRSYRRPARSVASQRPGATGLATLWPRFGDLSKVEAFLVQLVPRKAGLT
jgi:hypothetical protein